MPELKCLCGFSDRENSEPESKKLASFAPIYGNNVVQFSDKLRRSSVSRNRVGWRRALIEATGITPRNFERRP
jgi:hypothetical protein